MPARGPPAPDGRFPIDSDIMDYPFFIARRYLRRTRSGYLFLTHLLAVLSVAVGVTALILVLGVMNGFDRELRGKIIGVLPPVTVGLAPGVDPAEAKSRLAGMAGVTSVAPFSETQAILRSRGYLAAGMLRAVDLRLETTVTGIKGHVVTPEREPDGSFPPFDDGLLLGAELARNLRVEPGDRLEVTTGFGVMPRSFNVAGIFRTGLYHFDAGLVMMPLARADGLFPSGARPDSLGLGLRDIYTADETARRIREQFGPLFSVESWVDRNQALFAALALERKAMAVILALIVLVAGFNIVASLMMTVWRKSREIGVLRALGVTTGGIRAVFLWMGVLTGLSGVSAGLAVGLSLAFIGDRYRLIRLPGQFYGIDHLPIMIEWGGVLWISGLALLVSLLAALFPAQEAARVVPAVTLRAE